MTIRQGENARDSEPALCEVTLKPKKNESQPVAIAPVRIVHKTLLSERRRHGRVSCELSLNGSVGPRKLSVQAVDLSSSGACVRLPMEFSETREIVLSGQGLRSNSTVRAQVVWVRPLNDGQVLAGLHFLGDPQNLQPTWADVYLKNVGKDPLRRARNPRPISCDRLISVTQAGTQLRQPSRLVSFSPQGAQIDMAGYTQLGANLWVEISYGQNKNLRLLTQVVHQLRRGRDWRTTVQFMIAEDGREHTAIRALLEELRRAAPKS